MTAEEWQEMKEFAKALVAEHGVRGAAEMLVNGGDGEGGYVSKKQAGQLLGLSAYQMDRALKPLPPGMVWHGPTRSWVERTRG